MSTTSRRARIAGAIVGAGACLLTGWWLLTPPAGPRSMRAFDPDRTAALETDMWQAYYARRNVQLARDLLTLTHEQFKYPWATACRAGFHLARAAATFAKIRSNYDQVLPDLETGYAIARDWTGEPFDPAEVARAELAWWVARRTPGQDSAEQVGRLIAHENALLYQVPLERVLEASTLRAAAGRLRDEGGDRADWPEVHRLLVESYRKLHAAVQ